MDKDTLSHAKPSKRELDCSRHELEMSLPSGNGPDKQNRFAEDDILQSTARAARNAHDVA
jgi:hypothetical protein